jgi:hypothetical protein
MFPTDAKTVYANYPASGGTTCGVLLPAVPYTRTFLSGTIRTDGDNQGNILIGSTIYIDNNKNRDISSYSPITFTNNEITCTRANNKQFSFKVVYVDYDLTQLATSTQPVVITGGVALKQGFTYGEVLIILVLLMIFTITFFSELKQWIFGVRIENPMKNKYNKDL